MDKNEKYEVPALEELSSKWIGSFDKEVSSGYGKEEDAPSYN